MTPIADLDVGTKLHAALGFRVIAVLSRRGEGWCIYVDAVPGKSHDDEWQEVALHGSKMLPKIARAIAEERFRLDPGDLPYAR